MKFYGIKCKVKNRTDPNTDGAVLFYSGDYLMLTMQWQEIPPMHTLTFVHDEWKDLTIACAPMDYEPGRDRWVAPDFVEALYLRTSPDTDEYVCPTLHRPNLVEVEPDVLEGVRVSRRGEHTILTIDGMTITSVRLELAEAVKLAHALLRKAGAATCEDAGRTKDRMAVADLMWLLERVGSWTNARWDQHLRHEFGDERANAVVKMLGVPKP